MESERPTGGAHTATEPLDFYRLLRVDPDAPQVAIAEAYWRLAQELRMNRPRQSGVRAQLAVLNEAYATLVSPARREAHDVGLPYVKVLRQQRAKMLKSAKRHLRLPFIGRRRASLASAAECDVYAVPHAHPPAGLAGMNGGLVALREPQGGGPAPATGHTEEYPLLADSASRAAYDALVLRLAETGSRRPTFPTVPSPAAEATASAAQPRDPVQHRGAGALLWKGTCAPGRCLLSFVRFGWSVVRRWSRRLAFWAWRTGRLLARAARRFAAWAWPRVVAYARRFAASTWAATRASAIWIAARLWFMTKAACRLIAGGAGTAMARYHKRRASADLLDDSTIRSRLARSPAERSRATRPDSGGRSNAGPHPTARIVVEAGPQAGEVLELREGPVTVGADDCCELRLTDARGRVAGEHARIWCRQGRFVIGQLAGGYPHLVIEGRPIPWALLEDGDRIEIGEHALRFQLLEPGAGHKCPGADGA